jgi:hypothetical protein
METKQVWVISELDEPIKHEYDVFTSTNDKGLKTSIIKNSKESDYGFDDENICSLIEDGNGYDITIDNKTIRIDYSDTESLLALLSSVYETTMEIREESITKCKIN